MNYFTIALLISLIKDTKPQITNKIPNVLLIVVDDLRLFTISDSIQIPNIVNLARKGVIFQNAYAQQALCAPSRNSFLTGRRPDSLRLYDFYSYWRDTKNFTTLPQLFKQHGYETHSVGKIFHPGLSSNFTDDFPYSWSSRPYHPSTLKYKDSAVCPDDDGTPQANLVCPVKVHGQPEGTLPDLQSLERAVHILRNRNRSVPLFLAVGFYKPHIPLKCPEEYLDLYPLSFITLAKYDQRPHDMPLPAWHPSTDIRKRDDIAKLNISFPFGAMPDPWARKIKQSYFACVSYIDQLLGRLLLFVDEDTIVVLTSDHGWTLGENGMWAKYSNFDSDLRVPIIITSPGLKHKDITEPVELIDIFPTLVELAQLNVNITSCDDIADESLCFEGKSLVPLMYNSVKKTDYVALSQYPRPGQYPVNNSDKPHRDDIKIMGYSMRNSRFRYTEWIEFNGTNFEANWSNIYGVEVYDHSIDETESMNLYKRPGLEQIIESFAFKLRKLFKAVQ